MSGKKASILTNSVMYTIGNLFLKAFSFFLIPLYTACLSTEQYGIINLSSGFYTLASSVMMLGLQYAVVRYYADYKNDKNKVAKMFGTIIIFILSIGIVMTVVFLLFRDSFSRIFFSGIEFYPVVLLSVIISITSALYTMYQDILKGMQEAKKSVILSYVYFFSLLGLNLVTVVVFKWGAAGVLVSTLFVNLSLIVVMFIDLIKRGLFIFTFDMGILCPLLLYALPLVPHTIAYNISSYATKLIINNALSLSILGLYSLASQFGNVSDIVLNSVQSAFQPWFYGVMNENKADGKKQIAETTYLLLWLYGFIFLLIGFFSQEAIIIMANESYISAWKYVPMIVVSTAVKEPLYFYLNFMYYDKTKTKYVFVSTVIGSIINVGMTFLLVPYFQVFGSIFADIISMIIRLFITVKLVRIEIVKIYSLVKIEAISLFPILFLGCGLIPAYTMFSDKISVINIGIKIFVVMLYAAFVVLMNRSMIKALYGAYKKKMKKRGTR